MSVAMRSRSRTRQRFIMLALLVSALSLGTGRVGAQPPTTVPNEDVAQEPIVAAQLPVAFPQILNAPLRIEGLPGSPDRPPELDMTMLTVPAVSDDGITFAVNFASPFEIPSGDYKVSVVIGDPNGARTRYVFSAGENGGTVQKRDGDRWAVMEGTKVDASVPGVISVLAPKTDVPDSSVVWVEVEKGKGAELQTAVSPYFDYKGLTLGLPKATMVSSPVGWMRSPEGQRLPEAVAVPGAGVTISSDKQTLVATYADAVPDSLAGSPVTGAVDHIRIATGSVATTATAPEIQIDRMSRSVKLVSSSGEVVTDGSDQAAWMGEGFPAEDPAGSVTLRIFIHDAATALGTSLEYTDLNSLALGIDRSFQLENGNVVTATGVLATLGWFAFDPPAPSTTTTTEEPPAVEVTAQQETSSSGGRTLLVVGIATVFVVALIAVGSILLRRRSERRVAEVEGDFEWGVGERIDTETIWMDFKAESELQSGELPVSQAPADEPTADEPTADEPTADEPTADPGPSVVTKQTSPDDILAAFNDELDSITDRLGRLGGESST